MELFPVESRVVHFNNVNSGHGLGTIVGYNGVQPNNYVMSKLPDAAEMAHSVGLLPVLVASFYDGVRCPYVVQWDNGYKDVYEHSSVSLYDPNNLKHCKE